MKIRQFFLNKADVKNLMNAVEPGFVSRTLDRIYRNAGSREVVVPNDDQLPLDEFINRGVHLVSWEEFERGWESLRKTRQEKMGELAAVARVMTEERPVIAKPKVGKTEKSGGKARAFARREVRRQKDIDDRIKRKGKGGEQGNKNQGKKKGGKGKKK